MKDPGLWQRLQYHVFDDGTPLLSFRQRLAHETGWTRQFCIDAVEEYRKFIYLVAVSSQQLTPSKIVDEVWHLHLTYTHNYWDVMCAKAVRKPIHHAPTTGGFAEDKSFADDYLATLLLYRQEFSTDAPAEFWPNAQPATVISPEPTYDPKHYLLIPRLPFSIGATIGIALLALAASIHSSSSLPLALVGGIGLLVGAIGSNWGNPGRKNNNGSCGSDAGTCGGHGGGHGGGSCGGHGGGSCGSGH